jgi:enterochelin esterase-like enzyme
MRLDGVTIVVFGLVAVAGSAIALALRWDRTGRWRRSGLAAACVLSVAVTAALQLNRMIEAYPTWSALTGVAAAAGSGSGAPAVPAVAPDDPRGAPGGTVISVRVAGRASGMTLPVYVYLPPGYGRHTHKRYPVIEALHGYPGSPRTWIRRLNVQGWLTQEIDAGRMAPTVVLFPYQTPKQLLDTECTNLVHGPQAETFLTRDVPAYARAHLRVRTDRAGWALIGYSAGGFCATNLALRHPAEYSAAASLSGYSDPGITVGDGSEKTTNNDAWRLANLPQPAVSLYLAWAGDDLPTRRDSLRIARLAHAPLAVTTAVLAHGGHSDAAWQEMEAPAFDWLSAHLARPVT